MSIRAYRVNEILNESNPTFSLSGEPELMVFLERENSIEGDNDYFEVSVESLEKALKEVAMDDWTSGRIKDDIVWANEKGTDYIQYLSW